MTISMLAKVLPSDGRPFEVMQWPSVQPSFASREQTNHLFQNKQPSEAAKIQSELAQLKAELAQARVDAERAKQEAFSTGKSEGESAAKQAMGQQWEGEMAKLQQIMGEAAAIGPKLRRQAEEELVRLSVEVARRILHRELTIDIDALSGLIKAAFERVNQREIQQVRTDAASVAIVERIVAELATPKPVKVIADGRMKRGSLIIETKRGQLDASVETQLQEIERGFVDIVRQS